jgi:lambda repressor-like predicted transcriptional regulator
MSEIATTARRALRERAAEEIRALLARRRISAAELARRTGLKQSTLARRMTGETAFDLDDLELIAATLGVDVQELIPRRGDEDSLTNPRPSTRPNVRGPKGRSDATRPSTVGMTGRRPVRVGAARLVEVDQHTSPVVINLG